MIELLKLPLGKRRLDIFRRVKRLSEMIRWNMGKVTSQCNISLNFLCQPMTFFFRGRGFLRVRPWSGETPPCLFQYWHAGLPMRMLIPSVYSIFWNLLMFLILDVKDSLNSLLPGTFTLFISNGKNPLFPTPADIPLARVFLSDAEGIVRSCPNVVMPPIRTYNRSPLSNSSPCFIT